MIVSKKTKKRENNLCVSHKEIKQYRTKPFDLESFMKECNAYMIKEERMEQQCEKTTHIENVEPLPSAMQKTETRDFDSMSGRDFEYFCANLLMENGFSNVEITKESGDHGIDILAEKDGISYAIQCKCYSSDIGNSAVQQAHTGKSIYRKDIAVVLTNRHFTPQAREEAIVLGVKLWDREKINQMTEKRVE